MSEEAPEEGTPETPESGSPEEAPATPAFDWESDDNPYRQRYEDLRPQANQWKTQLDQSQQFIEALRDPDQQAAVLAHFGIELEADPEEQDDLEQPLTRAEWVQWQQQQQAQAAQAAQAEQELESDTAYTKAELERLGISEDDPSLDLLLPLAFRFRDNEGKLGIEQAHQMLNGYAEEARKAYLKSKRAPQVATGSAGTDKFDPTDDDAMSQALAADIAAVMEAEAA